MEKLEAWLTPGNASRLLGVCARTLHRWEQQGVLHPLRTHGGHRRYRLSELEQVLQLPRKRQPKRTARRLKPELVRLKQRRA